MEKARKPLALGVDIGGSKILSSVIDAQGKMLSRDHTMTPASEGRDVVIDSILQSVGYALEQAGITSSDIDAVGVAVPGLLNARTGIVLFSPNLPGWRDVPLREIIEERLQKKTWLINDANAAALAEFTFGAGRGTRHFIYVTISTGIGGGIVMDGEIYVGSTGLAGELGHMTIEAKGPLCSCGNDGCWETLASGTALAREAVLRMEEGVPTIMRERAGGDPSRVTAEVIGRAAEDGDALAGELIARTSEYLGIGLANLINIFNPERIVIGGGLSRMGDKLLLPAFATAEKRAFRHAYSAVRFARAELGRNSGVIGAAFFALRAMNLPGS